MNTSGSESPSASGKVRRIALTGATGYVGGLLLQPLAEQCDELRCITRNVTSLRDDSMPPNAVGVEANVFDFHRLLKALSGCEVAYYLIHSLAETDNFLEAETEAATTFARAAASAGVKRIIYLGALAQTAPDETSIHIESRRKVGQILGSTGVPVTEFRAPVVIGAGSMPFEAIRALVQRLPLMVTPRWVKMPVQPIAAPDLVKYLVGAAEEQSRESHVYEIGGADVTDYAGLMRAYARTSGLKRMMIPVPVITPRLSSLWLKLVTPAHYRVGRRIVDSAAHSSVVADDSAERVFGVNPVGYEQAIKDALESENDSLQFLDELATRPRSFETDRIGTKIVERRRIKVDSTPAQTGETIRSVGGENGWFWGDWLWDLRGGLDRLVNGPGMRRGMTMYPPEKGGIVDFWTVERVTNDRLTLRAEMKLPGEAWLDLTVRVIDGETHIDQTAAYDPRGLFGLVYWYALYPLHSLVFGGMLRGLKRAVEEPVRSSDPA